MAVRLIIEDLEGSTTVVPLGSEEVTIGRKEHNTIQLTEQNVSRSHARLQFHDDGWVIHDLGSYNGIKINGVPIAEPTLLRESDLIQIGDYHLTLTDEADKAAVGIARPANDAMGSSSGDLPVASVEDLEPVQPAGAVAGPPAVAEAAVDADERESGKGGLIVGVLLGAALLLGGGAWFLMGNAGEKDDESTVADNGDADGKTAENPADAEAGAAAADNAEVVEPVPADSDETATGGEEMIADAPADTVEAEGAVEAADTTDGADPEPADTGMEVVEEVPDSSTKKTTKKKPKPKTVADPSLSPDEALAAARKAMVDGKNKKAYDLAKQAYDGGKGGEALSLMGVTACKMGSASKAKSAYKKLSGSKKEMLEKVCEPLGISLE